MRGRPNEMEIDELQYQYDIFGEDYLEFAWRALAHVAIYGRPPQPKTKRKRVCQPKRRVL